jgi:nitrogen-specific signal transduction histidine kinase
LIGAERSLLSFVDAPVVVGDPDGRCVYVNPAFENRFGVGEAASTGKPLGELFGGGAREAVLRAVAEVCARGRSERFQLREAGIGYAAVASPIVAQDTRVGVVILLKEEVEGSERMLAILREIQDPLDEVQSTLDELLEQTGGRRNPRHRAELEVALRAVTRLRKWVDELGSALSGAAAAGQSTWQPAEVLHHVAARFEADVGTGATRFELLVPAALPDALGDGTKLEAMLLRLLRDRFDADPAPQTVTLGARTTGRGDARAVLISLTEQHAAGFEAAAVELPPLVREVVASCGGELHVAVEAGLGRVTLVRIAAPVPASG